MFSDTTNSNGSDAKTELFSFVTTGNAMPVLHQIRHALQDLLEKDTPSIIDLGAIPFAAGDERMLDEALGIGEVTANLNVMGASHVQETAIPGVWRVDHFNEAGETQSRFIEVTYMPEILKTQREDAEHGLSRLSERLRENETK